MISLDKANWSKVLQRVLVGVVCIPLLLILYYKGGMLLKGFLGLLTVLSSYEIIKMYENKGVKLLFFNVVSSFLFFYCIVWSSSHALFVLFCILLLNGIRDIFLNKTDGAVFRISGSMLTVLYPAIGFGLFFRLGDIHQTLIPTLAIMVWITDTFAYLVGMKFGKHRGIFKVSPMKSIEGFIGAIIFVCIGAVLTRYIDPEFYTPKLWILLALSAGFFGQIGDLFESLLKRDFGVKDSSKIIPGHGGVLDRFDSLLVAAPVLYILLELF